MLNVFTSTISPTCHRAVRHVVEAAIPNFVIAWVIRGDLNRYEVPAVPCAPLGTIYVCGVGGARTVGGLVLEVAR